MEQAIKDTQRFFSAFEAARIVDTSASSIAVITPPWNLGGR
jgi:hypothetical protein